MIYWGDASGKRDTAALDRMLPNSLILTHSDGRVQLKVEYLDAIKKCPPISPSMIVWSSPSFIKSFEAWRLGSQDQNQIAILLMDDVLREIRNDLGSSNKGINRCDLIKLFLKDPRELDEMIENKLQK